MCEKAGSRRGGGKGKPLGVFGLVTAAAFGLWVKAKISGSHAAPVVKTQAAAAQSVATGSGFPVATVVVTVLVTAAAALVVWFVVRKFRDILEDRRLAEATRVDQVEQVKARAQREQIAMKAPPRVRPEERVGRVPLQLPAKQWRCVLEKELSPGLFAHAWTDVIEAPANEAAHQVRARILNEAQQILPGKYQAQVELVDQ